MAAVAAAHAAIKNKNRARPAGLAVDVEKVFDEYDHDGSGDMDISELKTALSSLKINASDSQINNLMDKFSKSHDARSLDIETFNNLVQALRGASNPQPSLPTPRELPQDKNRRQSQSPKLTKPTTKWGIFCAAGPDRLPFQRQVLAAYQHWTIVSLVACLIMGNFIINIIEKEIDPASIRYKSTWDALDVAFNWIFLVELLANIYSCGGPFAPFWNNGWNVFDFFIVMVGMVLMGGDLPPSLSKLKLLRAFRIFRLFKRIESLNKIVVAIIRSLPGVFNAFIIMLIFFCIYAILAVDLFRDFGLVSEQSPDHTVSEVYDIWDTFEFANRSVWYDSTSSATLGEYNYHATPTTFTTRGLHHGSEYYGTFFRALFTLFQVMTGESWAEAIARPLLFGQNSNNGAFVTFFFVSFILIMQFVLVNVVVAVLLDKFVEAEPEADEDHIDENAVNSFLDSAARGGAPAGAPSTAASASTVQLTRGGEGAAGAGASSRVDDKLDSILNELLSLKREVGVLRSEVADLKGKQPVGSLSV